MAFAFSVNDYDVCIKINFKSNVILLRTAIIICFKGVVYIAMTIYLSIFYYIT